MSNPPSSSCHISTDMTSFDIIFSKASCTQKTGERCQREMGVHRAESERETTHLLGNSAAGAEQQAAAGARVGETNTKLSWPRHCPGPGDQVQAARRRSQWLVTHPLTGVQSLIHWFIWLHGGVADVNIRDNKNTYLIANLPFEDRCI